MTKKKITLDQNGKFDLFSLPEFCKVRTTVIDGTTYYAACDVAKAIGYSQPMLVVTRQFGEGILAHMLTGKRKTRCTVITIEDVYRLVLGAVSQNRNVSLRKKVEPIADMLIGMLGKMAPGTKR